MSLLRELLAEEHGRRDQEALCRAIDDAKRGLASSRTVVALARFDVTIDLHEEVVLLEDALDATVAGLERVPMAVFVAAIDRLFKR